MSAQAQTIRMDGNLFFFPLLPAASAAYLHRPAKPFRWRSRALAIALFLLDRNGNRRRGRSGPVRCVDRYRIAPTAFFAGYLLGSGLMVAAAVYSAWALRLSQLSAGALEIGCTAAGICGVEGNEPEFGRAGRGRDAICRKTLRQPRKGVADKRRRRPGELGQHLDQTAISTRY